jgi:hypothetical protein
MIWKLSVYSENISGNIEIGLAVGTQFPISVCGTFKNLRNDSRQIFSFHARILDALSSRLIATHVPVTIGVINKVEFEPILSKSHSDTSIFQ